MFLNGVLSYEKWPEHVTAEYMENVFFLCHECVRGGGSYREEREK